jgi:hypothetical protein
MPTRSCLAGWTRTVSGAGFPIVGVGAMRTTTPPVRLALGREVRRIPARHLNTQPISRGTDQVQGRKVTRR